MALISISDSTDAAVVVSGQVRRDVIAFFWNYLRVFDTVTTVVKEYRGLSESDAATLAASLQSNTMTNYYAASQPVPNVPSSWINIPNAQGVIVTASYARQNDSRMFVVTVTTETHVCSNSAGWTAS